MNEFALFQQLLLSAPCFQLRTIGKLDVRICISPTSSPAPHAKSKALYEEVQRVNLQRRNEGVG